MNTTIFETSSGISKQREVIRIIYIAIYLLILIIGTVGNTLTFIVMQRGSLRRSSTCFYMAILAVADLCKYMYI